MMDDELLTEVSLPESNLLWFLKFSNSSALDRAFELLIEVAKSDNGRSDLASKNVVTRVLQVCKSLSYLSSRHILLSSLKLLRNLCAGEIHNQNEFLEQNGVQTISGIISAALAAGPDCEIIRIGLQTLGNVCLAGMEHQHAFWHQFFPLELFKIAGVRSRETFDPLCMVIYTCCEGTDELIAELFSEQGFPIVKEIIRTASIVGFGEDWFNLFVSRICLEKSYLALIFSELQPITATEKADRGALDDHFVAEQAFLLSVLSEILNEQTRDIIISSDFPLCMLGMLRNAVGVVDFTHREMSCLPTGTASVDVLGYSLTILRDICAFDGLVGCTEKDSVDLLVSSGLIELLLDLLRDLEPPAIIKKVTKQSETQEGKASFSPKCCLYKGYRRDIVAILGNCAYHRKHVQDEIRDKDGILLLLQQCVADEDNPFLREWGIWSARNLLEGNAKNQQVVSDLEFQGSVDVPELDALGLRVEVDPETHRAKLVNVT